MPRISHPAVSQLHVTVTTDDSGSGLAYATLVQIDPQEGSLMSRSANLTDSQLARLSEFIEDLIESDGTGEDESLSF